MSSVSERAGIEAPTPPLAQHHRLVALAEHVLGRHQPLVDGGRRAPVEHDRLADLADVAEQREVLHVVGADLEHVDVAGGDVQVLGVDHLGRVWGSRRRARPAPTATGPHLRDLGTRCPGGWWRHAASRRRLRRHPAPPTRSGPRPPPPAGRRSPGRSRPRSERRRRRPAEWTGRQDDGGSSAGWVPRARSWSLLGDRPREHESPKPVRSRAVWVLVWRVGSAHRGPSRSPGKAIRTPRAVAHHRRMYPHGHRAVKAHSGHLPNEL